MEAVFHESCIHMLRLKKKKQAQFKYGCSNDLPRSGSPPSDCNKFSMHEENYWHYSMEDALPIKVKDQDKTLQQNWAKE